MVKIEAIGDGFAGEVSGVQLWQGLDDAAFRNIAEAWPRFGVLLFRRQALSEDELIAFSACLGEVETVVRQDWASKNRPEIIHISNMRNFQGEPIGGLGAGDLDWHTDQSYVPQPATGSVIYCVELPKDGGNTYWANLYLAYEALPQRIKQQINGRHAIYSYLKRTSGYDDEKPMSAELKRKTPDVTHPMVHADPLTGREALYLDPSTMIGIEGMAEDEGRALLDEINAHATRPEFVYRHEWQIGDVIIWDNAFLLHRRDPFDPSQSRIMKRTIVRLPPSRHIVPEGAVVEAAA